MQVSKYCCLGLLAVSSLVAAQEPKTLVLEQSVIASSRKLQPYEIAPGTVIQMAMLSSELIPVAQVTANIYDMYGKVTIPAGSRLVGKYNGKQGSRYVIYWDGLQLPAVAGTLRLDPPLLATMPDGSAGVVDLEIGQLVATITEQGFVVPHNR